VGHSNRQMVLARIEELVFALDVLENQGNPKLILLNKIDDLLEIIKE
jgi:hypothetical protein